MKKLTLAFLAAFMVAVLSVPTVHVHADVTQLQLGAGAGFEQKDSVGGQKVLETLVRRPIWGKPVSFSSTSATSTMLSVTMTPGYASTYKGPWFVRVYNTGKCTAVFTPLTFSAAYTGDLTAIGTTIASASAATNGVVEDQLGAAGFGHMRGQTDTATGFYQLGKY